MSIYRRDDTFLLIRCGQDVSLNIFFYDEKLEQKAYLVTKYKFYLKVSSDYSVVKLN